MSTTHKLTPSEKIILRELIFQEPFEHLLSETGFTYGTLRDDLITLINHRFVEVFDKNSGTPASAFYDSDNIERFFFKATKTGLKRIQNHAN